MLLVARLGDFEVVRGRNLDAGKNPVDAVGLLLVTICFFCQPMRNVLTLDEFVNQHWVEVFGTDVGRALETFHAGKSLCISLLIGNPTIYAIKHPFLDILGGNLAYISMG